LEFTVINEQALLGAEQMAAVQALANQLSSQQLIWVSGYLAGRAGVSEAGGAAPAVAASGPRLTILYGSQTGNGEKLAEQLQGMARERGINASLNSLGTYKKNELKKEQFLLLIMSTHGEGDPPDTALELHEFIFSKRAPELSSLRYSVLALGDTSYEHFCKTGRDFDERFTQLGGTAVFPRQDCDVDYEEEAARWMTGALDALAPFLNVDVQAAAPAGTVRASSSAAWSKSHPFPAPLLERVNLNGRGSAKQTLHIELSLEESGLTYAPGDAIGVLPTNQAALVEAVVAQIGADPEQPVTVSGDQTCSLREALMHHYEITVLTRPVVQKYAGLAEASSLAALLENGRNRELLAWTDGRDLLDMLKAYPVPDLAPQMLIDLLRKLPPRLYSIASSLKAHPDEAHLTVGVVQYASHGRDRLGVCSNYLADVSEEGVVPVYIHENRNFKLPPEPDRSIIMIGPGTGVAPFRAFIEERQADGATGRNWLFFGDQHFTTDFLYQTELLQYHKSGVLTRLDVAFSRDQAHKVYVQHRMQEQAAELYRWIADGAYVYVCGDANRMAPDVHAMLVQILGEQGGLSPEAADEYVKQMIKDKRYQRDTY
jgi:sulfite reductase (NADPH) flavoprotein alpha-component